MFLFGLNETLKTSLLKTEIPQTIVVDADDVTGEVEEEPLIVI